MLSPLDLDRERRLDEVLADYLRELSAGATPDRRRLLDSHPDLADDLAEFFADQDRFNGLAAPLRGVVPAPARLAPLKNFGPYEVLGEIARGGMGVVYRARHARLHREVALKMLLVGPLASPADLRRFQLEAEAVASLHHPRIVPIYDVGTHDGHPYLSMRLLEGGSLAQSLARGDWRGPGAAARAARLLLSIADAVHYAHQRGILHRDLKPANILLDLDGRPHVADFGLAKRAPGGAPALGEDEAPTPRDGAPEPPPLTHPGAVVGTPAYMTPEQASGEHGAVTTAADVYGLGAVLYELLTGRPPFKGPTALDTLRQVAEDEPVRPRLLNRAVDRDLETICLKCLQKSPRNRYASAADLAEDLRRYLAGEAIQARPVGQLARAWRWARREPAVATLAACLAVALPAGFGMVLHEWRRAEANAAEARALLGEAQQAQHRAEYHQTQAEASARDARTQRDRALRHSQDARANFQAAHQAVRDFCLSVNRELENAPGLQPLRRKLLLSAQSYYRGFLKQRGQDPDLRMELANTHALLGRLATATGSRDEALAEYQKALAMYRELHRERPADRGVRCSLTGTLVNLSTLSDVSGGLAHLQEARALYERFLSETPGDLDLATGLAQTLSNLAVKFSTLGRIPEALDYFHRALEQQSRLLRAHPRDALLMSHLAVTLHNLGVMAAREPGGLPLTLCYHLRAHELRVRLARAARPGDARRQADLAASFHSLGVVLRDLGRGADSRAAFKRALAGRRKLAGDNPYITRYRVELSSTLTAVGFSHAREGRRDEALRCYDEACKLRLDLVRQDPSSALLRKILAENYYAIGTTHGALGRRREEGEAFARARPLQEELVRAEPANLDYRADLGHTLNNLGCNLMARGQLGQARVVAQEAIANGRILLERGPGVRSYRSLLSTHYNLLAEIERRTGRPDEAAAAVRERRRLWPCDPQELYGCSLGLVWCAEAVGAGKSRRTAEEQAQYNAFLDEAVRTLRRAVAHGFRDLRRLHAEECLNPLRPRADFRTLLEELKEKR
jgi:tetratricopeptide (TPR) repeat protein